ncbi:MAG TPA: hypothetical protein VHZ98_05135, partial [Galbitalea sp.]|nr:hypothetical protein [Galbitalea sp.]
LLGILFAHVATSLASGWWDFFAFALLAIGMFLLFLWRTDLILRIAFIVAAVGWALLAIGSVAALSGLTTLAIILALVGTLVAGIMVILRHTFTRNADLAFLLMAIFAALVLLATWVAFLGGTLGVIIAVIFGILLIVSGLFIQRRR